MSDNTYMRKEIQMKKCIQIVGLLILVLCIAACGKKETDNQGGSGPDTTIGVTEEPSKSPTDNSDTKQPDTSEDAPVVNAPASFPSEAIPTDRKMTHGSDTRPSDTEYVYAEYVENGQNVYEYFTFDENFYLFFEKDREWTLNLNSHTVVLSSDLLLTSKVTIKNGTIDTGDSYSIINGETLSCGLDQIFCIKSSGTSAGIVNYGTLLFGYLELTAEGGNAVVNYGTIDEVDSELLEYNHPANCVINIESGFGIVNLANCTLGYTVINAGTATGFYNNATASIYEASVISVKEGTGICNAANAALSVIDTDNVWVSSAIGNLIARIEIQNGTAIKNYGSLSVTAEINQTKGTVLYNALSGEATLSFSTIILEEGCAITNYGTVLTDYCYLTLTAGRMLDNYGKFTAGSKEEGEYSVLYLMSSPDDVYSGTFIMNNKGGILDAANLDVTVYQSDDAIVLHNNSTVTNLTGSLKAGCYQYHSEIAGTEIGGSGFYEVQDCVCINTSILYLDQNSIIENFNGDYVLNSTNTLEMTSDSVSAAIRNHCANEVEIKSINIRLYGDYGCGLINEEKSTFRNSYTSTGIWIYVGDSSVDPSEQTGNKAIWNLGTINGGRIFFNISGSDGIGFLNSGTVNMKMDGSLDVNEQVALGQLTVNLYKTVRCTGILNYGDIYCDSMSYSGTNDVDCVGVYNETVISSPSLNIVKTFEENNNSIQNTGVQNLNVLYNKGEFKTNIMSVSLYSCNNATGIYNEGIFEYNYATMYIGGNDSLCINNAEGAVLRTCSEVMDYTNYQYPSGLTNEISISLFSGNNLTGILNKGTLSGDSIKFEISNTLSTYGIINENNIVLDEEISMEVVRSCQYHLIENNSTLSAKKLYIRSCYVYLEPEKVYEGAAKITDTVCVVNNGELLTSESLTVSCDESRSLLGIRNAENAVLSCKGEFRGRVGTDSMILENAGEFMTGEAFIYGDVTTEPRDDSEIPYAGYYGKAYYNGKPYIYNTGTMTMEDTYVSGSKAVSTVLENCGTVNTFLTVIAISDANISGVVNQTEAVYCFTELDVVNSGNTLTGSCGLMNLGEAGTGNINLYTQPGFYCIRNGGTIYADIVTILGEGKYAYNDLGGNISYTEWREH